MLGGAVICLFIMTFWGVVLAKHLSVVPPLAVTLPQEQWFSWVLFQFVYVALPEELFFRGYFLSRSIRVLRMSPKSDARTAQFIGAISSAAFFAISHMLLWGNMAGLLTFIPGLLFAWLFVRMRSLFPPALMHGAANVAYALSIQAVF